MNTEQRLERALAALDRLGSGEGFTMVGIIDQKTGEGAELMVRMRYARESRDAILNETPNR